MNFIYAAPSEHGMQLSSERAEDENLPTELHQDLSWRRKIK